MSTREFPGRGTSANPPNRYEPLHVELDPEDERDDCGADDAASKTPTLYYRDASRTILAENDSPDVRFRFSINPYRGCEHGCVYCLAPETPILHADMLWRPIGETQPGDVLVGFDEMPSPGKTRKFRKAVVEAVWWSKRPTVRLITEHADVRTTANHRWLQSRDFRWSSTERLSPFHKLRHMPVVSDETVDDDYRVGYLAGLSLGDGTFRYEPGWRSNRLGFPMAYWRVALVDDEPLERSVLYLRHLGVDAFIRPFSAASTNRKPLRKVEIRSLSKLARMHDILTLERATRSYRRGFVAGFFDAEGCCGDSLRISQVSLSVLDRIRRYAAFLGFQFGLEVRTGCASTLRLVGRLVDRIRFFGVCQPAILRKMHAVLGREMNLDPEPVHAVEGGPSADVVDIQTSTGTFYAAGLATHNCYARPSHEYLGFSAGLDFERRLLVKENAPELLRETFASSRWEPEVIALSGNTDCYQPIERRLRLTRRCLEVFRDFRNPVSLITKSALISRDADLLAELAADGAAVAFISVTTLDAELARRLEPRAAHPERRLEAIGALARVGVPVGVLVAPVIPGLNDAEIPRIIDAAARAGARSASWVLLRLPKPVDDLFQGWLDEHYPERRERVLGHIRETRNGRLTDTKFGRRMRGQGEYAAQIAALFEASARRAGLNAALSPLRTDAFRRPPRKGDQLQLL